MIYWFSDSDVAEFASMTYLEWLGVLLASFGSMAITDIALIYERILKIRKLSEKIAAMNK